jgi:hypothetical protein
VIPLLSTGKLRLTAATVGHEASDDTVPYPMAPPEDLNQAMREVEALGRRIVAGKADVRNECELRAINDRGADEVGSRHSPGQCRDRTNAVLWLASDQARFVAGVALPVDAGFTNRRWAHGFGRS